jgi:exopolyphosphatase/pppGpp-phosphohydrolase
VIDPEPEELGLLRAAAMLHEIGMAVAYDSHQEHPHYLILTRAYPDSARARSR